MTGNLAEQALLAVLSLCGVLLLILGAARLAKAVPALRPQGQMPGGLVLVSTLALDRNRRLHLVGVGECRVLLLVGGGSDVLITLPAKP